MVGEQYTVVDMACLPWARMLWRGYNHPSGIGAKEILNSDQYAHIKRWIDLLMTRPAVRRGFKVCRNGVGKPWLTSSL